MTNSRFVRVYGRDIELPIVTDLSLPKALGNTPTLTVLLGAGSGSPFEHDTGMRFWLEGAAIHVEIPDSYGPLATEHLILDHAVPIGLSAQGDLILHGAGVERDGRGAVLLGPSGRGKSVTSHYLSENGWRVLSDDAVRVEVIDGSVVMWPGYDGVRLHEDSFDLLQTNISPGALVAEYGTKRRVAGARSFTTDSALLHTVFVLGPSAPSLQCDRMRPAHFLSVLAQSTFHAPVPVDQASSRLKLMEPLVARLVGYELSFDRTAELLAPLSTKIASIVQ